MTVRSEHPTERKLKRQLRRFISMHAEIVRFDTPQSRKTHGLRRDDLAWLAARDYKLIPMPGGKAATPEIALLKNVYGTIRAHVVLLRNRHSYGAKTTAYDDRLVNVCKRALYETRPDCVDKEILF